MTERTPVFEKVLIANRGEIAVRIIRTLREMGIAAVAVHHRSEALARHVTLADQRVEISGPSPVAAYLDADQIIAAAKSSGADAIHPGYGFLSENADFARRVTAAGLTFIGPDADTIALMGDKISSRQFAEEHGIPVAPSLLMEGDTSDFATNAEKLGFPLLIKASAGGGGKGMSIVHKASELEDAMRTAASEAKRYFDDDRVYAEVYVARPRHIEVQILGDGSGNVVHLFERECSVQRRFQKIIEEAPAANLPEGLRSEICAAAVRLAKAAKYRNAGTVEFILGDDGRFFFLEMNTRLQVEHPVTEMVTGTDLVREQILIAAGQDIPFVQADLSIDGHAIECRICAEDPENDFFPETGSIRYLSVPTADHLRFESALEQGQSVTADFDPMLAKLVAHGADRLEAIARASAALDSLAVLGVTTNIDYLGAILGHHEFAAGRLHTGFVAQHKADLAPSPADDATRDLLIAIAVVARPEVQALLARTPEPLGSMGAWRN